MANITKYQTTRGATLWRVRYRKPGGRQTDKRGFKRKIDAERWAAKNVTVAQAEGTYIDPQAGKTTIGSLSTAWLAKKKLSCKPSYYDDLEDAYNKYVQPDWGAVPVSAVQREAVQTWAARISNGVKGKPDENGNDTWIAKPKSASVVLRAHGILAGILDDAVTDRRIHSNPARGVELPRKTRRGHVYLTAAQLYALADQCEGRRRTLVLLLGLTGMRWGEAIGLTAGDVDKRRHRISVSKSATQVRRRIIVGTPKTHELRTVVYPDVLDAEIRELTKGRAQDDLLFPDPSTADGYMHQPPSPKANGISWFARACERAGLERMRIHDLRHTAASLMVQAGANVKAVQRQLGHASAAMTLDTYADLFDDDLNVLGEAMSALVLGNVGKMWAEGQGRAA